MRNLLQTLILRNAVLHVNHVVADPQIAEVRNKRRRLRSPGFRPRRHIRIIGEIVGPEENQVRVKKTYARRQR